MDGRGLYDYRTLKISFPHEPGFCEVQLGHTRVYVVVRCEVVEPYPDRPTEGFFLFSVQFSPLASAAAEPGSNASEEEIEVGRLIERSLRETMAIDTEALCIRAGEKVWAVNVNIHILDDGGNLIDAVSIATISALLHFRRPDVSITGDSVTIHSIADRDPVPLSIHHMPICVTFAIFNNGDQIVVDPWWKEEQTLVGRFTIIQNQHRELCGVHKLGHSLPLATLLKCSKIAAVKVQEILQAIQTAITAHPPTPAAIPRPFHIVTPSPTEILPPKIEPMVFDLIPSASAASKPSTTGGTTPIPFQDHETITPLWADGETNKADKDTPMSALVDSFLSNAKKEASVLVDAMEEYETNKKVDMGKEVIELNSDDDEEEEVAMVVSDFSSKKKEEVRKAPTKPLPANDLSVAIKRKNVATKKKANKK